MKELDSKDAIPLYPYFVIDEILYTFEKTKTITDTNKPSEIIMIKGGSLKPFVINKEELDTDDPNRKIMLEILKQYYQLPDTLDITKSLDFISKHANIQSHTQLRTLVLLAYNTEIIKSMENAKLSRNLKIKYLFILILIIVVIVIIAFIYRRYY